MSHVEYVGNGSWFLLLDGCSLLKWNPRARFREPGQGSALREETRQPAVAAKDDAKLCRRKERAKSGQEHWPIRTAGFRDGEAQVFAAAFGTCLVRVHRSVALLVGRAV